MNITPIINQFRIFLNTAWTGLPDWIKNKEESRDAIDDWFQANWEAPVEAEINQFFIRENLSIGFIVLEIFGSGADCNGASSRVCRPTDLPTHFIKINNLYRFDSLGNKSENGWFEMTYPFDYVKVLDGRDNEVILEVKDLTFELIDINH